MLEKDLHFHDLRGSAATMAYMARLLVCVIAEIMTWGTPGERNIRRDVNCRAATQDAIRQINEARSRTGSVKPPVKPLKNSPENSL